MFASFATYNTQPTDKRCVGTFRIFDPNPLLRRILAGVSFLVFGKLRITFLTAPMDSHRSCFETMELFVRDRQEKSAVANSAASAGHWLHKRTSQPTRTTISPLAEGNFCRSWPVN
jgi:hypothetical protein